MRILIVEDEQHLADGLRFNLEADGYEAVIAGNGLAALKTLEEGKFDAVVLDVMLPGADGFEVARTMRERADYTPILMLTARGRPEDVLQGFGAGADDYLPKPFTIDALYAAVEARLKKVQAVRQEAEKKLADLRDNISLMLPHELRTPLNGILAYGEILAADAGSLPTHEVAEMGQVIGDSGKRLERLIENFLIYAECPHFCLV